MFYDNFDNDELIPNFYRLAYSYKMIVEDNMKKIRYMKSLINEELGIKISNQQVIILLRLSIVEEIPMKELAKSLNIHLSNLVSQLKKLEQKNLIIKRSSEEDMRIQFVRLKPVIIEMIPLLPKTLDMLFIDSLVAIQKDKEKKAQIMNAYKTLLDHLRENMPEVINAVYKYN